VVSVVYASVEPFGGNYWNDRFIVDGKTQGVGDENSVSPGFFTTLGTRLVAGRDFDEHDVAGSPPVAIVNQAFVKEFLGGGNALGRTFHVLVAPGEADPSYEVVGVALDTKYDDVRKQPRPMAYYPEAQATQTESSLSHVQIIVRAGVPIAQLKPAISAAARQVSPGIVVDYSTIDEDIRQSFVRERMMAVISGFFGALAALIAMIGLYGVMSYMVARRRNEIGIRMALGAGRSDVVRMVLGDASKLLGIGLVIGAIAAAIAAQAVKSLLFGLTPQDPATLIAAAAGLGAIALVASYLPARRASRLEPTIALREE
jgi:predicted permease